MDRRNRNAFGNRFLQLAHLRIERRYHADIPNPRIDQVRYDFVAHHGDLTHVPAPPLVVPRHGAMEGEHVALPLVLRHDDKITVVVHLVAEADYLRMAAVVLFEQSRLQCRPKAENRREHAVLRIAVAI